ncbi:uncharacterized protein LOC129568441 [Sitodiplosis mosellana]|uniref:uncharacterized protein LOC129568441 n=1 Tax=Sitodiplosis mosellana TaxID=263140 RepID=UPI002443E43F|nr:uncharacterized protein LOC129568441 [Sitodiplosis mosellana]
MRASLCFFIIAATLCMTHAFLFNKCGCSSSVATSPPAVPSPCSCTSQAVVPAPQYYYFSVQEFDEEKLFRASCKCNCHDLVQAPDGSGDVYFRKPAKPKIEADPVSIAIALRAAQRSTIKEDQLAYGFRQRPIDQPRRKVITPNIPEERLFDVNAKVIEFKKPKYSEESEFDVDESDEELGIVSRKKPIVSNPKCFYYSDIGYSESTGTDRKFVNVPISTTPAPTEAPINADCLGRIIDIPEERNIYLEQLLAEYGRSCQCDAHKKEVLFTRR